MFREMSQMAGLLRQLPKIKEEMEKLQQRSARSPRKATQAAAW